MVWNLQNSKMHMKFIRNAYEMHVGFSLYFFQIQILCCGYKMGQLSDLLVDWNLLEHSTSSEHSLTNGSSIRPTCELKFTWGLHFTWAIIHKWVSYQTYLWVQIYLSIEVDGATSTNYKYNNHKYQSQVAVWINHKYQSQEQIRSIPITSTIHKYQSQVAVWMGYSQVVITGSNQK